MDGIVAAIGFFGDALGALFAVGFFAGILYGSLAQAASDGGWKQWGFWYFTVPCYLMSLFIAATIGKVLG